MNIFDFIKKLVFYLIPLNCAGCGEIGLNLCDKCGREINFIDTQVCPNCRAKSPFGNFCSKECTDGFFNGQSCFLNGIIVCCKYEKNGIIEKLITRFKYKFSDEIKNILSPITNKYFDKFIELNSDFIIPVPLHSKREKMRGFNQSEILCEEIIRNHPLIPIKIKIINRKYNTLQQAKLSRAGRLVNLTNAFTLKNLTPEEIAKFSGKNFIIIDDVCTTGSTLNECARALQPLKPKKIYGLVLARG